MRFTRVNKSITDTFNRLTLKVLRLGNKDVQTALNAANFGVDSNPIKNMVAIFDDTGIEGESVIIGYIKADAIAQPGETHLYSTNSNGADSFRVKLLTDGTAEIGGNADFAVRFNALKTAYNELQGKVNDLVDGFNLHVHGGAGTPPVAAPPLVPAIPSTGDIDPAKIEEVKVS